MTQCCCVGCHVITCRAVLHEHRVGAEADNRRASERVQSSAESHRGAVQSAASPSRRIASHADSRVVAPARSLPAHWCAHAISTSGRERERRRMLRRGEEPATSQSASRADRQTDGRTASGADRSEPADLNDGHRAAAKERTRKTWSNDAQCRDSGRAWNHRKQSAEIRIMTVQTVCFKNQ